jgi:hypothetical protein
VITGFNTDIEFDGVTYHVQTEDKGLARPVILSLVYDRGTILASKRAPYDDLINGKFDEAALAERLQKQHKLICAAVRAGRIEDLKKMTLKESSDRRVSAAAKAVPPRSIPKKKKRTQNLTPIAVSEAASPNRANPLDEPPIPKPEFVKLTGNGLVDPPQSVIDEFKTIEAANLDEILVPEEAVAIVSELGGSERPANSKLDIVMLGNGDFKGGERHQVSFMVVRGSNKKVVDKAQIMVKILGSSFRPLIFHASTDQNGIAKVNLQVPNFNAGRAAFLVRASSEGDEVELRRAISHG